MIVGVASNLKNERFAMIRTLLLAVAISPSIAAMAQQPTNCTAVQFPRGAFSTTVSGSVGSDEPFPCYTLSTGNGQTATLKFTRTNRNMAFTIYDVVDDRDSYTFRTQAKIYKLIVFQTLRAVPAPFTLALSVH